MHVQRDGVHFEAGALGLAGPVEVGGLYPLELFQRLAYHRLIARSQGVVNQGLDAGAGGVEIERRIDVRS